MKIIKVFLMGCLLFLSIGWTSFVYASNKTYEKVELKAAKSAALGVIGSAELYHAMALNMNNGIFYETKITIKDNNCIEELVNPDENINHYDVYEFSHRGRIDEAEIFIDVNGKITFTNLKLGDYYFTYDGQTLKNVSNNQKNDIPTKENEKQKKSNEDLYVYGGIGGACLIMLVITIKEVKKNKRVNY